MRWLGVFLVLVAATVATGHSDLHRARKYHSSHEAASHRNALHATNHWIVKPTHASANPQGLVSSLNRALIAGSVRLLRSTRTGFWVLEATPTASADELTALLMSEQRAQTIEWFHRDSVAVRKSH